MRRFHFTGFLILSAALALGACDTQPTAVNQQPAPGIWRGEIDLYGTWVPFSLDVDNGPPLQVAYLNGSERMPVEMIREDGPVLHLDFPSYSARLQALVTEGTRMQGTVTIPRRDKLHELSFRARHDDARRFLPPADEPATDLTGSWGVDFFFPGAQEPEPSILLLEQDGQRVTGNLRGQLGDFRFMEGDLSGDELRLSMFDGGSVSLLTATLDGEDQLSGILDTVTYQGARIEAYRNEERSLEDPTQLTWMREDTGPLAFTFPDLQGQPVSLSDAMFQDKVVIVVIGGSWCPTCHDEAVFMGPLYREYRDQGLEVIYLMFEYSDDLEENRDQLEAYRDRYQIEHTMLFAGDAARATRSGLMPQLNDIIAFPTTILLDRQGQVRNIHTVFPGPATGQAHEDYKRNLVAEVESLLAEAS